MSGLNDDFILADDSMEPKDAPAATVNAFKDTTSEGEIPELRADLDLIAVATEELEIKLRDLELLQGSIREHGGMSQTIALEAQALLPEFITDERPIGFFTKHPSKTMLATALEEIEGEKKGILVKIKDFIVTLFQRIAEWFKSVLAKVTGKNLGSKENVEAMAKAEETVKEASVILLSYDKEAYAAAEAAQARVAELQKRTEEKAAQAEEEAAKKHSENLSKLNSIIESVRKDDAYEAMLVMEFNALLTRLPHVQKALSDPSVLEPLVKAHEASTVSINVTLTDLKRAIDRKDHEAVSRVVNGPQFDNVAQQSDSLVKAIAQFRALGNDFRVKTPQELFDHAKAPGFLALFKYGKQLLQRDMEDHKGLLDGLEQLTKELYHMELYNWGKNPELEKSAKESLDALKTFHKDILTPAVQRVAFSYQVVAQLLDFLGGLNHLGSLMKQQVKVTLRKRVLEEAKKLGISEEEANSVLSST